LTLFAKYIIFNRYFICKKALKNLPLFRRRKTPKNAETAERIYKKFAKNLHAKKPKNIAKNFL